METVAYKTIYVSTFVEGAKAAALEAMRLGVEVTKEEIMDIRPHVQMAVKASYTQREEDGADEVVDEVVDEIVKRLTPFMEELCKTL